MDRKPSNDVEAEANKGHTHNIILQLRMIQNAIPCYARRKRRGVYIDNANHSHVKQFCRMKFVMFGHLPFETRIMVARPQVSSRVDLVVLHVAATMIDICVKKFGIGWVVLRQLVRVPQTSRSQRISDRWTRLERAVHKVIGIRLMLLMHWRKKSRS